MGGNLRAAAAIALVVAPLTALPIARSARAEPGSARYVALPPCRLADTRQGAGPVGDTPLEVDVAGRCGVPDGTVAAAFTVTVTETAAAGFATVTPGDGASGVSNLNWETAAATQANGAVVRLGPDGTVRVTTSAPAQVVIDVTGAFVPASEADAGRFVPLRPTRLVDTRAGGAAVAPGGTLTVPLPTGVPADASALAVTVTAPDAPGWGFWSVAPAGAVVGDTSILNSDGAGQTRAAGQIVTVSASGFTLRSSAGGHVVVDVTGWFTGASAAVDDEGLFRPIGPSRALDTRDQPPRAYPDGTLIVGVDRLTGGEPAAAVVANFTMTRTYAPGYLTVYPARTPRPLTSTVNASASRASTANLGIAPLSTDGLAIHSSSGTDVLVDVAGWFSGPPLPTTGQTTPPNVAVPAPWESAAACVSTPVEPEPDGLLVHVAGPFQSVASLPHPGPLGPIAVVGDSLTWDRIDEIARGLRDRGWGPVCVDGTISRTIAFGSTVMPDGLDAVARIRSTSPRWSEPDVTWMVALGTNDVGFAMGNGSKADRWIADLLAAIGPTSRPVTWVNVRSGRPDPERSWEDVWNAAIGRAPVRVVDWAALATGRSDWFKGDDIHLTDQANAVRLDLVLRSAGG